MQTRVLVGVGAVIVTTLLTVVLGSAAGGLSEQLARDILNTVLVPAMAAGATIVGCLFASSPPSPP